MKDTLEKFKTGDLNCIVATEVLEEGLDVTKCNLVIRFDDIPNFRAYVQSKGRARARETYGQQSRYIMMAEACSPALEKLKGDVEKYRELERSSLDICHNTSDSEEDTDKSDEDEDTYYAIPEDKINSPRITKNSAVSMIYRYTQQLPTDGYTKLMPYFELICAKMDNRSSQSQYYKDSGLATGVYRYVLHMPHLTPYSGKPFEGPRCLDRKIAKQKVALLACEQLHKDKFLGSDLLPIKRKREDFVDNLSDEDSPSKKRGTKACKNDYNLTMADEFNFDPSLKPFFMYKINTMLIEEARNPKNLLYRPEEFPQKIGFLVNQELPEICSVPNYYYILPGKVSATVQFCGKLSLSDDDFDKLLTFQVWLFDKVVGCKASWMWLDREKQGLIFLPVDDLNQINFKILNEVSQNANRTLYKEGFKYNSADYKNVVITPIHKNPEEHYFVEETLEGSNPYWPLNGNTSENFAMYYENKYKLKITDSSQELLRVSGADHRYHMFTKVARKENANLQSTERDQKFLPKLVWIEPIPASLWREIQLMPFVMNRLTSMIRIKQFLDKLLRGAKKGATTELSSKFTQTPTTTFGHLIADYKDVMHIPGPRDVLKAFTLENAGEEFNMERLEILGDVFLKYSVGVRLFCNKEYSSLVAEGVLSQKRSQIVGNKRLWKTAIIHDFPSLISAQKFEPYLNASIVRINDKSLADTVESLLGCFLEHSGQIGALMCMQYLGLDEKGSFEKDDLPNHALLPHCMENDNEIKMAKEKLDIFLSRIHVAEVEEIIGYTFKEKSVVLQSLTHASYIANRITPSYERLEFLGDAVLDYLITGYLYTYKEGELNTPGIITDLRSALVNNNAFATVVVKNGLHKYLLQQSPELFKKN